MSPAGSESSETKKAAPSTASRASPARLFRVPRACAHRSLSGDVPEPRALPSPQPRGAPPPPPSPGRRGQGRQVLLVGAGGRRVVQDPLKLLLQGARGQQAARGVGAHAEEPAPVEDGHVPAVAEVAEVVWGGGGQSVEAGGLETLRIRIATTPWPAWLSG